MASPSALSRILCPIDLSEVSRHAIEHAIGLARQHHARVTALHVYNPLFVPLPNVPPFAGQLPHIDLQRVNAEVAAWVESAPTSEVAVDAIVDVGLAVDRILEHAASLPADLIAIGTHGLSGFQHVVLGSITEKVLRRARCPVLTVPPRAGAAAPAFKNVLCAVDFSEPSCRALELAALLAPEASASLAIVHVVEWPWHEPPAPVLPQLPAEPADALANFRSYLEKTASDRLRAVIHEYVPNRAAVSTRVAHGKAYVEVLRIANEIKADLIVMGVHGRNALDMTLFGSTTNQIVRRAACPVLTWKH